VPAAVVTVPVMAAKASLPVIGSWLSFSGVQ